MLPSIGCPASPDVAGDDVAMDRAGDHRDGTSLFASPGRWRPRRGVRCSTYPSDSDRKRAQRLKLLPRDQGPPPTKP